MGHDSICVGFRYRARRGPRGEDNRKMALIKRPSMEVQRWSMGRGVEKYRKMALIKRPSMEVQRWKCRGPGCGKVQKDGAHKRPSMEGSEMEVGPGVWKSGKVHAEERTGRDGTGRDGTGRDGTGQDLRRRRRVSRTLDAHGARSRESRPRTTRRPRRRGGGSGRGGRSVLPDWARGGGGALCSCVDGCERRHAASDDDDEGEDEANGGARSSSSTFPRRRSPCGTWSSATPSGAGASCCVWDVCEDSRRAAAVDGGGVDAERDETISPKILTSCERMGWRWWIVRGID